MKRYLKMFAEAWSGGSKKKIIVSFCTIGVVCAIAIGVTVSFFSDTETSTGNQFVAGKLNLQIDNTCHYDGMICTENKVWAEEATGSSTYPELIGQTCECTWSAKDLSNELFFNFPDVKPGDEGEDTVSLHVDNNDAWVCAELANLVSDDNGCDSPENKLDTTCGAGEGELKENLFFSIWKDNGVGANACNNIKDADENYLVENQPATSNFWPIADFTTGTGPIPGDETYCLGIAWNVPIATSNIIQTDSLKGDVIFNAVQSRNMPNFKCSDLYTEVCGDSIDNNYDGQIDENCCVASPEICDDQDNDCDGAIDEDIQSTPTNCGVGACYAQGTLSCISGQMMDSCNPGQPSAEICDGTDNDCDGQNDNGLPTNTYYADADGDTWGSLSSIQFCSQPSGYATRNNDCNDTNPAINPMGVEVPGNNLDENCSGMVACYIDADNDTYGSVGINQNSYPATNGTATTPCTVNNIDGLDDTNNDCNDSNATIRPNATEVCNGVDDDCDGAIDETFPQQGQTCSFNAGGVPVLSSYQCLSGVLTCGPGN
jgi:predicted ribosomally synthesized peptide with SipW-like signal peptide